MFPSYWYYEDNWWHLFLFGDFRVKEAGGRWWIHWCRSSWNGLLKTEYKGCGVEISSLLPLCWWTQPPPNTHTQSCLTPPPSQPPSFVETNVKQGPTGKRPPVLPSASAQIKKQLPAPCRKEKVKRGVAGFKGRFCVWAKNAEEIGELPESDRCVEIWQRRESARGQRVT